MAVKIALAVGLFIVICGPPALKSSQVVPDGLVYTEVKKTLVRGVQGVLTCRFYGKPIAVYWEKGFDPDDLSLMVIWHDGEVSGPRFDDGSCNVDENYSLIINNVSAADAGRINCKVSNYKGILIKNYTDIYITDTALATNPHVTLQMREGTYGILQCTVHIKAKRVSGKKRTTSSGNESLVVLENNEDVFERSGTGYDEGTYNITHHYSLVINEVQIHHEGLYVCEVTDFDTGISFRNQSFVNVVAQPLKPFPTIQECLNTDYYDSNYCTLVAESGFTLTCEAVKYYPAVYLRFIHGSRTVEPLYTKEWNNADGTINKTLTIAASGGKELYTCVASNIPGTSDNKSTSVLLHDEDKFESFVLVIILTLFSALILISSMAYFIWRKKHSNYSSVPGSAPDQELEDVDVKNITADEMQALVHCVYGVLMKHYRRISDDMDTKPFEAENIIGENTTALFHTHRMLIDWQQRPTSTKSQYRRVFHEADKSDHIWPSNDELKLISRHLTQESMKNICKTLKIGCKSDDANDDGKGFDSLRKWRNKVTEKSLEEKHEQLSSALGSINLKGLLPFLKGQFIYQVELVDLAFQMLLQDLLPIAEALGIHFTKLITYRPAFEPSHLDIGTIGLLSMLLRKIKVDTSKMLEKGDNRPCFCSKMSKLQYRDVAILGMCVYEMSYGELFRIEEAMMAQDTKEKNAVEDKRGGAPLCDKKLAASKIGPREEGSSHGAPSTLPQGEEREQPDIEKAESVPGQLGEPKDKESKMDLPKKLIYLRSILQLTDDDIANGLDLEPSDPITTYTLLKLWKEKPRQSVFNYRAALANKLRIMKMTGLADEVIAGNYINEQTNLEFIQSTVQRLKKDQLRILGDLLQLSKGNESWHTSTSIDVISKQIYDWVAVWTMEMKISSKVKIFTKMKKAVNEFGNNAAEAVSINTAPKKHRDLNDSLVEGGILALAREVMIIEQQLAWL